MNISPSVMSADMTCLADLIRDLDGAGVDRYHLDVMDGQFVPNITFGPGMVKCIRKHTTSHLDAHLMIVKPQRFIRQFIEAGADTIILHVESDADLRNTMQQIIKLGGQAGVTLNPDTPLDTVKEVLDLARILLIMSVFPGFSGQSFIPETIGRIRTARSMIDQINPRCRLMVDGGLTADNAGDIGEAGADILVAASAVFNAGIPPAEAVKAILDRF